MLRLSCLSCFSYSAFCCVVLRVRRAADGDYNVVCPARAIARDVSSKSGKPVYLYYFSHGPAASLECERKGSVGVQAPILLPAAYLPAFYLPACLPCLPACWRRANAVTTHVRACVRLWQLLKGTARVTSLMVGQPTGRMWAFWKVVPFTILATGLSEA